MAETPDPRTTRKVEELYRKGLNALEAKQYDYAVDIFLACIKMDPGFEKAAEAMRLARQRKLKTGPGFMQKMRAMKLRAEAGTMAKMGKWDNVLGAIEDYIVLIDPKQPTSADLTLLGQAYANTGMQERAVTALRAAVELDPGNMDALRELGKALLALERFDEAKPVYDKLSEMAENVSGAEGRDLEEEIKNAYARMTLTEGSWEDEGSFRTKTVDYAKQKKEDDAAKKRAEVAEVSPEIRMARQAVKQNPDDVSAWRELARLCEEAGLVDEATEAYLRMAELEPESAEPYRRMAEMALKQDDLGRAARGFERAVELAPSNVDLRKALAEIYVSQERLEQATEQLQKAAELAPDDADVHDKLGELYQRRRFFDDAIREYEQVVRLRPDDAETLFTLGNLYVRRNRLDEAAEAFEKLASLKPDDAGAFLSLAEVQAKREKLDAAIEAYSRVVELDPDNASAAAALRELRVRHLDGLLAAARKRVAADPSDQEAAEQLRRLEKEAAELKIDAAEERLAADPDNPVVQYELGELYFAAGRFNDALALFQKAAADEQHRVRALNMIGRCFEKKDMLDLAAAQFETALSDLPTMNEEKKEVLYNLGRVREKMGDVEKALDAYKQIYQVDIGYRDVGRKIEEAYKARGDS